MNSSVIFSDFSKFEVLDNRQKLSSMRAELRPQRKKPVGRWRVTGEPATFLKDLSSMVTSNLQCLLRADNVTKTEKKVES